MRAAASAAAVRGCSARTLSRAATAPRRLPGDVEEDPPDAGAGVGHVGVAGGARHESAQGGEGAGAVGRVGEGALARGVGPALVEEAEAEARVGGGRGVGVAAEDVVVGAFGARVGPGVGGGAGEGEEHAPLLPVEAVDGAGLVERAGGVAVFEGQPRVDLAQRTVRRVASGAARGGGDEAGKGALDVHERGEAVARERRLPRVVGDEAEVGVGGLVDAPGGDEQARAHVAEGIPGADAVEEREGVVRASGAVHRIDDEAQADGVAPVARDLRPLCHRRGRVAIEEPERSAFGGSGGVARRRGEVAGEDADAAPVAPPLPVRLDELDPVGGHVGAAQVERLQDDGGLLDLSGAEGGVGGAEARGVGRVGGLGERQAPRRVGRLGVGGSGRGGDQEQGRERGQNGTAHRGRRGHTGRTYAGRGVACRGERMGDGVGC